MANSRLVARFTWDGGIRYEVPFTGDNASLQAAILAFTLIASVDITTTQKGWTFITVKFLGGGLSEPTYRLHATICQMINAWAQRTYAGKSCVKCGVAATHYEREKPACGHFPSCGPGD